MYQLKLDGYRAIAFNAGGKLQLSSRNDNDFSIRYPAVLKGLGKLPDETVSDGEVVAFDEDGRPSFNALQTWVGLCSGCVLRVRCDDHQGQGLAARTAVDEARAAREKCC